MPTLSQHAASARGAYWLFVITLTVLGALFYWWLVGWFVPRLGLSPAFTVLLTAAILGQIIAAIIPDTSGWPRRIHRVAAYGMAILYLPLSLLIILAPGISTLARAIAIMLALYMLVTFIWVVVLKHAKERFLFFQLMYIVAFQVLILAAGYLSHLI